jgi:hypothetical protein
MDNLVELFTDVDDFMKSFLPHWELSLLQSGQNQRCKPSRLSPSEVMTLVILFHQSHYRTLKHFYMDYVQQHLRSAFPDLVSYSRFVRLQQQVLVPLCYYLDTRRGQVTGISYIDSTALKVCHNKRINRHKTFAGIAERGKTTMGWFYGFKLHLVVNDRGELLSFCLTAGNVDDRQPVDNLCKNIMGKLFGDRGYISQKLTEALAKQDLQLITSIRSNMKNKLLTLIDKILLRKRFIIETINDQLKNISQIEHTRHRSIANFCVNLVGALVAYTLQSKKPSLNLDTQIVM